MRLFKSFCIKQLYQVYVGLGNNRVTERWTNYMSECSESVEIYLSFAKGSKKTDSQIISFITVMLKWCTCFTLERIL